MDRSDEVFVVDDDQVEVLLIKRMLKKSGFCRKINTFENGRQAYDALKERINQNKQTPNLIILDLNMPEWNGWDFLEAVKADPTFNALTVVINSSTNHPHEIEKAKGYDIVRGVITKPLTIEKLQSEMEK